jgi:hypothetical protein
MYNPSTVRGKGIDRTRFFVLQFFKLFVISMCFQVIAQVYFICLDTYDANICLQVY